MSKLETMRGIQLIVGGALLMLANLACAQFVWVDAKGVKQYSDRPPPPEVPLKKILKSPGRMAVADAPDGPAQKLADGTAPARSSEERELDYRKRQKEKAAADAKAAATANNLAQRKEACDAARIRNVELASGKRLRGADNAVLDDNARAAQQAMTNQALADCG